MLTQAARQVLLARCAQLAEVIEQDEVDLNAARGRVLSLEAKIARARAEHRELHITLSE